MQTWARIEVLLLLCASGGRGETRDWGWSVAGPGPLSRLPTHLPLQARLCNNMQKARELWDSIMTKGNARYANMWLEYYNLER